jgi:2-(1,2-epoxy-1,2-dihydrophenyl)acetyl-CoA isomerase
MIDELVTQLYAALGAGDRAATEKLLADEFVAEFAEGMPAPIGGPHAGADAIDSGWWEIGRRYRVRAIPQEQIRTVDGRLLVLGRYRGTARDGGAPIDAEFAHLWTAKVTADGGRLTALRQFTDTQAFVAAPKGSRTANDQGA